jgi:hypothetical protein
VIAALTLLSCLSAGAAAPGARVERPEFVAALDKGNVMLTARGGFHINPQYPLRFSYANGAVIDRAKFSFEPCAKEPKESCVGRAPVPMPASLRIEGTFAFSVCDPERCLIEKIQLSLNTASAPQ